MIIRHRHSTSDLLTFIAQLQSSVIKQYYLKWVKVSGIKLYLPISIIGTTSRVLLDKELSHGTNLSNQLVLDGISFVTQVTQTGIPQDCILLPTIFIFQMSDENHYHYYL